jgi:hypothetical protein
VTASAPPSRRDGAALDADACGVRHRRIVNGLCLGDAAAGEQGVNRAKNAVFHSAKTGCPADS